MTVVVADAAPLHYLIQIGYEYVLPRLFTKVWIPGAVAGELRQEQTPPTVHQWAQHPPSWIEIIEITGSSSGHESEGLDRGEWEAIVLARKLKADLLLMDERAGVRAAREQGLTVTGTLGVMVEAARAGLLSIDDALARLSQTNFRRTPKLFAQTRELVRRLGGR